MRLGIFGGTFDPPHVGHLLAAEDAVEHLTLDRLIFVPAATQPLKVARGGAVASADQRLAMVRLLANGDPRFDVSPVEVERSGLSFTVDTLTHFATEYPKAERFLLLGADVMATFAHWREPRRVLELATPVVLTRSDEGAGPTWTLPNGVDEARICRLPTRRVDVSSSEVRERARNGKTLRGFVTDDVAAYIERTRLYR